MGRTSRVRAAWPDPPLRPEDVGLGLLFWRIRDAAIVGEAGTGRIVLWNPAAEALFGYRAADVIGQPIEVLIPERMRPAHRAGLARYTAGEVSALIAAGRPVESPALRRGGDEITIELSLSPLEADDAIPRERRYVLAVIRDVTERVELDMERAAHLAAAQEQLRRREELARLQADFSAMVAHELHAPSAAIRALADALGSDELPAADRAAFLAAIRVEAALLHTLIGDVREAMVVERDEFAVWPRPVPAEALLAVAAGFAHAQPGEHPVRLSHDATAQVSADPERVGQVLRNLVGNAAKYAAPGTPIDLRARRVGTRLRLEVADQGPGIPPEEQELVFTKFGRGRTALQERRPGLGLGLYLSRRILQAHGSDLTLTSTPGVGSTFAFELELAE